MSGVDLSLRPGAEEPPTPVAEDGPVKRRREGTLRHFRALGTPLRIEGFLLNFSAEIFNFPIEWVEYKKPLDRSRPETAYALYPRDDEATKRGTFWASMRVADVSPLIERLIRASAEAGDMTVNSVRVGIKQVGDDSIRLAASARARWKFLSAAAKAKALVQITPDAIVTVQELQVRSGNLLVALALRIFRKRIRSVIGMSIDLNR